MLRWRLLLGVVFTGAILWLCRLDAQSATPGVYLLPLALLVTALASQETLSLTGTRSVRSDAPVVYVGNLALTAAPAAPDWLGLAAPAEACTLIVLALGLLATFVRVMHRYERPGDSVEQLAGSAFALLYVGMSMSFIVALRLVDGGKALLVPLLSMLVIVKMGDIGAYALGRLFGRHKMAPVLSPGKTWEGIAGALLFGVFAAWLSLASPLVTQFLGRESQCRVAGWIAAGVCIVVAGVIGDLAESLLKRDAGRKDSSTWMPGFGGVLDLLDSIFAAAPVAYLLWALRVVAV